MLFSEFEVVPVVAPALPFPPWPPLPVQPARAPTAAAAGDREEGGTWARGGAVDADNARAAATAAAGLLSLGVRRVAAGATVDIAGTGRASGGRAAG